MRKNRDVAWENLEVTKNKLENKFDDIGQMVSEIVNMCCKNPSICSECDVNRQEDGMTDSLTSLLQNEHYNKP